MTERTARRETVLASVHPHPLGMYPLYLVWLYIAGVGAAMMHGRKEWVPPVTAKLDAWLASAGGIGWLDRLFHLSGKAADSSEAYLLLWVAALMVPALVLAVTRISLRWLMVIGATAGLALYMKYGTPLGHRGAPQFVDDIENLTLVAIGFAGVLATEVYRRAHRYVVTDKRIILHAVGAGSQERSVFYGRIDDLVVSRPLLGSLFGFATLIPITSSGLGLGADSAGGALAIGGEVLGQDVSVAVHGSRSQNEIRPSLAHTLFNVPDPDELYQLIVDQIGA